MKLAEEVEQDVTVLSAENPDGKLFLRWLANRPELKLRGVHKATAPLYRTKGIEIRDREG